MKNFQKCVKKIKSVSGELNKALNLPITFWKNSTGFYNGQKRTSLCISSKISVNKINNVFFLEMKLGSKMSSVTTRKKRFFFQKN